MTDSKFTNFEFICEFSAYEIGKILTDFIPVEDMREITSGSLWKSRGPLCTTVHWLRIWTKPGGLDGRDKDPNTGVKVRIPEEFFNIILEKHKAYMDQLKAERDAYMDQLDAEERLLKSQGEAEREAYMD